MELSGWIIADLLNRRAVLIYAIRRGHFVRSVSFVKFPASRSIRRCGVSAFDCGQLSE